MTVVINKRDAIMLNLPDLSVLNRITAKNAQISPTADSNNAIVEKKNFSIGHPQRMPEGDVADLFAQFDFDNLNKEANGVLKGNMTGEGWFHLTPGVVKFQGSGSSSEPPSYPPVNEPPANDTEVPSYPNF